MTHSEFEHKVPSIRPLMVRVGRNFFGNADDAEDVAQDALIRLWTYCEKLDAHRNLDALSVMVAKNVCIDRFRERQRLATTSLEESLATCDKEADASIIAEETASRIDNAVHHLPPREKSLFIARHIEDKSLDDITLETGIPKQSVKSMLSAVKAKLKRLIYNET